MRDYRSICLAVAISALISIVIGCAASPENKFLGEWQRVEASGFGESQDWAKVTLSNNEIYWENPDGKFPATLEEGKLYIDVEGFPAMASYDDKAGILTFTVHGNSIEYKKKG